MARKDLNGINGKMVRDTKQDEAPKKKKPYSQRLHEFEPQREDSGKRRINGYNICLCI